MIHASPEQVWLGLKARIVLISCRRMWRGSVVHEVIDSRRAQNFVWEAFDDEKNYMSSVTLRSKSVLA